MLGSTDFAQHQVSDNQVYILLGYNLAMLVYHVDALEPESIYPILQKTEWLRDNDHNLEHNQSRTKDIVIIYSNKYTLQANLMSLGIKKFLGPVNYYQISLDEINLDPYNLIHYLQAQLETLKPTIVACFTDSPQVNDMIEMQSQKKLFHAIIVDKNNDSLFALAGLTTVKLFFPTLKNTRVLAIGGDIKDNYNAENFCLLISKYPDVELIFAHPDELNLNQSFIQRLENSQARTKLSHNYWNALTKADVIFWDNFTNNQLFETDLSDWIFDNQKLQTCKSSAILLTSIPSPYITKNKRYKLIDLYENYLLVLSCTLDLMLNLE